jgi:hypothetical protein
MTNTMDDNQPISPADAATPALEGRREWSMPRVARLSAGEAELGANPAATEGAFAMGS